MRRGSISTPWATGFITDTTFTAHSHLQMETSQKKTCQCTVLYCFNHLKAPRQMQLVMHKGHWKPPDHCAPETVQTRFE
jgi:hypothetical protein